KLSWFYHADQGTRTFGIPFEWFMALEQPTISLFAVPLFNDPAYMDRYGFTPDTLLADKAPVPTDRPHKQPLPIGFAAGGNISAPEGNPWRNPRSKQDMTGI